MTPWSPSCYLIARQPANRAHHDRGKVRSPVLCDHFPVCRGCCQPRSIPPHPRGHPTATFTTGFFRKKSAQKPERKRLSRPVQTGVNQTQHHIILAAEPRNCVQAVRLMTEQRASVPKWVDRDLRQQQNLGGVSAIREYKSVEWNRIT